jgi:hypothetical protein
MTDLALCVRAAAVEWLFLPYSDSAVLDREAYDWFSNGLSDDPGQLIDQLNFVGDQYGAVQERFLTHDIRTEAALVAPALHRVIDQWLKAVNDAKPLIEEVPDESTIAFLFSPFRATKQWPVWASKTLHFLRPDAFPILDSNVKKPLDLRNLGGSSGDYHRFCSCFRDAWLQVPRASRRHASRMVSAVGSSIGQ